ncbi:DUF397 domain-containing protein [Nonomuraea sp. NEAU-A123]|nr:DUF397 domain-containing protein [Nonomuraea sp. NEAU-A123]
MDRKDLTATELTGAVWRKSSRSGNGGGNCVEVAARGSPGVSRPGSSRRRAGWSGASSRPPGPAIPEAPRGRAAGAVTRPARRTT